MRYSNESGASGKIHQKLLALDNTDIYYFLAVIFAVSDVAINFGIPQLLFEKAKTDSHILTTLAQKLSMNLPDKSRALIPRICFDELKTDENRVLLQKCFSALVRPSNVDGIFWKKSIAILNLYSSTLYCSIVL